MRPRRLPRSRQAWRSCSARRIPISATSPERAEARNSCLDDREFRVSFLRTTANNSCCCCLLLPLRRSRFLQIAAAEDDDDDDDDNDDNGFQLRNTLLMWSRMNTRIILCIIFDKEDRLAAAVTAAISTLSLLFYFLMLYQTPLYNDTVSLFVHRSSFFFFFHRNATTGHVLPPLHPAARMCFVSASSSGL